MLNQKSKNNKTLWLYGKHCVTSILKNRQREIYQLLFTNSKLFKEFEHLINDDINIKIVDSKYLEKFLPPNSIHQNCAIEVKYLNQPCLEDILEHNNCLVILDQVKDPQNVGAIIRSSAAFSVGAVITTYDNSPEENSTIIKAASGAFEIIPYIKVTNLNNCMNLIKKHNYWCIGLDVNGSQFIDNVSLPKKVAFIMGSEESGLRNLTKKNCDLLIKLRISNEIQSLNVSNALAITLHEYYKQLKL